MNHEIFVYNVLNMKFQKKIFFSAALFEDIGFLSHPHFPPKVVKFPPGLRNTVLNLFALHFFIAIEYMNYPKLQRNMA